MKDEECTRFLQSALPKLRMRWQGFRKVRSQVCKRIARRLRELQLDGIEDYEHYLATHPPEWRILDTLCQVTISRFYRDKAVFDAIANEILPRLAQEVGRRGEQYLNAWSVGCGSGEEPYTLGLLWKEAVQEHYPTIALKILATDSNEMLMARARKACYPFGSIKDLPPDWRQRAFVEREEAYCLKHEYRSAVRFARQDVREQLPKDRFDLVLCRNLVFTYFDDALQCRLLEKLKPRLHPGGALVIGSHEHLPAMTTGFGVWSEGSGIYRAE